MSFPVCKPSLGNHLLYLHMSSHYRRICAAKCVVDTSPPRGASNRWQPHIRTCSPKKYGLGFADIITSDTKQSPRAYTWVSACLVLNIAMLCYKIDCPPRQCGIVYDLGQDIICILYFSCDTINMAQRSFELIEIVLSYITLNVLYGVDWTLS